VGSREALDAAAALAVIDVVNSGTWLVVVVLLETEVWLQLKDLLSGRVLRVSKFVKAILYAVLFVCAIYGWFYGDFLDFWDAFLWMAAFIFIEMNIFKWQDKALSWINYPLRLLPPSPISAPMWPANASRTQSPNWPRTSPPPPMICCC
jgi:hypothetical protein